MTILLRSTQQINYNRTKNKNKHNFSIYLWMFWEIVIIIKYESRTLTGSLRNRLALFVLVLRLGVVAL